MDAEDLLLRQFLGILRDDELAEAARWIRSQQRADGTWANFEGGPGDLSTTIEAYAALRLAGDAVDDAAHGRGTRLHPGQRRHRGEPGVHPHLAGAVRRVVVGRPALDAARAGAASEMGAAQRLRLGLLGPADRRRDHGRRDPAPVRSLPFTLAELRIGRAPGAGQVGPGGHRVQRARQGAEALRPLADQARPLDGAPARRAVGARSRQEADGGWGGIQPPWVYSILALHLLGLSARPPGAGGRVNGLDGFLIREETRDGVIRRLEACQSPVWDTCLALIALFDSGAPLDDPAVQKAIDWLLGEEVRVKGDWAVKRPDLSPAGWAFEFANDAYPDIDDTAEVVLALRRVSPESRPDVAAAVERGTGGRSACSRATAAGAPSTPTTPGGWSRRCRSATSARSSIRRRPTSPRTSSRCSVTAGSRTPRRRSAGCAGCSMRRRPTARGSGAGARTTSTAPAR